MGELFPISRDEILVLAFAACHLRRYFITSSRHVRITLADELETREQRVVGLVRLLHPTSHLLCNIYAFKATRRYALFIFFFPFFFLKDRVATQAMLLFSLSLRDADVYLTNVKVTKTGQKLISSRYRGTFQTRHHPPKEHSPRRPYGEST